MSDKVLVTNRSEDLVLVGEMYLLPGASRRVFPHVAEIARQQYGDAVRVEGLLNVEPPAVLHRIAEPLAETKAAEPGGQRPDESPDDGATAETDGHAVTAAAAVKPARRRKGESL